ncbi:MAG: SpoIID/LytB domain-containing protein, partial [Christensenellales bacterium]
MQRKVLVIILCVTLLLGAMFGANTVHAVTGTQGIMRVKLTMGSTTSISVTVNGNYSLAQNSSVAIPEKMYTIALSGDGQIYLHDGNTELYRGSTIKLKQHAPTPGTNNCIMLNHPSYGKTSYLGDMEFIFSGSYITVINHVYIEEYLYGVLPYEMSDSFPFDALKAQAVAARTYAIRRMGGSGAYDVEDTSKNQVYRGYNKNYVNSIAAVKETSKQVLKYGGTIADAYFSASNGGWTETPFHIWGRVDYPYYQIQQDPYDTANTESLYEEVFFPLSIDETHPIKSYSNVKGTPNIANAELYIKQAIVNSEQLVSYGVIDVDGFTLTGMLALVLYEPDTDGAYNNLISKYSTIACKDFVKATGAFSVDVDGTPLELQNVDLDLRYFDASNGISTYKVFNASSLRLFTVEAKTDETGTSGISIYHKRYGHGAGLSQRGAQQRAGSGQGYAEILSFYYPGTAIEQLFIEKPVLTPLLPVLTPAGTVTYDYSTLPIKTYTYSVSKKAGVNPIAYDKNGNIVKDYGCYYAAKGSNTLIWNGKNSSGKTISSSLYPVYIKSYAMDDAGNRSSYTTLVKINAYVDTQPPVLTSAGTATYDCKALPTKTYTYSVSEKAGVNPIAYDKNGNIVK